MRFQAPTAHTQPHISSPPYANLTPKALQVAHVPLVELLRQLLPCLWLYSTRIPHQEAYVELPGPFNSELKPSLNLLLANLC